MRLIHKEMSHSPSQPSRDVLDLAIFQQVNLKGHTSQEDLKVDDQWI